MLILKGYRGGISGNIIRQKTAQDIINYERKILGNKLNIVKGIKFKNISSEKVFWITQTYKSALQYGKPITCKGGLILATDNYGGYLITR